MVDGETDAVQGNCVAGERPAAAVFAIAENGAMDGSKLQADLMLAAGDEANFDERSESLFAERAVAQAGVLGAAGARGDDFHASLAIIFKHPMRKLALGGIGSARSGLDERPIDFFHGAALKLLRET